MAVYQFSALANGQAISFNPSADQLQFDQTTISAAAVTVVAEGANLRFSTGGKSVILNSTALTQLATTNVTFANGSLLLVGDNNAATAGDSAGNGLTGGAGADQILGLGGNDTVNGGGGNDWIAGGTGNDSISGSGGADMFVFAEYGAANADTLTDFAGNAWDSIRLDASAFSAIGASGRFSSSDARFWAGTAAHDADDRIVYNSATGQLWYDADGNGAGAAQLIATLSTRPNVLASDIWVFDTPVSQTVNGTAGNDSLTGGAGNDTINGLGGSDTITGNAGDDLIDGGPGNNILNGGAGADTFAFTTVPSYPANSNFIADFAPGTDRIQLDGNAFAAIGPSGGFNASDERFWASSTGTAHDATDRILYNTSNGVLSYDADGNGSGAAVIFSNLQGAPALLATDFTVVNGQSGNAINGTSGDDTITGTPAADAINGLEGNDFLQGGLGADTINGGAGNDQVYAAFYGSFSDDAGNQLFGGDGDDVVGGGTGNDLVQGDAGNDYMWGSDGADTLIGGAGVDDLFGQSGSDTFVFNIAPGNLNYDGVRDLESGVDTMQLDASVLTALGASGTFSTDDPRFYAAYDVIEGHDADDRIIYDTHRGWLYYDPDGSGAAPAQYIANLADTSHNSAAAYLVASDFVVVNGTASGALVQGGSGNDSLTGGNGNDTLVGGAGNDTMSGGAGNDWYVADADDTVVDSAGHDAVRATSSFTLGAVVEDLYLDASAGTASGTGNAGANYISGNSDANVLSGLDGGDSIWGGDGADTLLGGNGNDTLNGGWGNNRLDGGAGNDLVVGALSTYETFVLSAAPGDANADYFWLFDWDAIELDATVMPALGPSGTLSYYDPRMYSAAGATGGHDADDRIVYDTASGRLYYDADGSGAGAAQLLATLPNVYGSGGASINEIRIVNGSAGGLSIDGTSGDDALDGTAAADTMNGFAGNDSLNGGAGDDSIDGGDGNDSLSGGDGNDTVIGGAGNDMLAGDAGNDTVLGGDGDDSIIGVSFTASAGEHDLLDGGVGNDALSFWWNASSVVVDLGAGTLSGGGASATLTGIENVTGTSGADRITGDAGANVLDGAGGADTVNGAGGDDTVYASGTITGGTGADSFVFTTPTGATVTDFASGLDKIHLDARQMYDLDLGGNFSAGDARFYAAAGATAGHDADDRVIFNTSTGQLFYDHDGSGADASQLLGTFQPGATVVATDIFVDNGNAPGGTITGTAGNDSLVGTDDNDTIAGLGGDDTLDGGLGNDVLDGGAGNDSLFGGDGGDRLIGGDGNDTLLASSYFDQAFDTLEGGLGDDTYVIGHRYDGQDTLFDSGGIDTVDTEVDWTLGAGFENLILRMYDEGGPTGVGNELNNVIRSLDGYSGGYRIDGAGGNDTLLGGGRSDVFLFRAAANYGNDVIDGGEDADMIAFTTWEGAYATSGVTIDLRAGTVSGGMTSGSATVTNVEDATGGDFNDHLIAHNGMTYFERHGDEITRGANLSGMGGDDTLEGGADNDQLTGGTGSDAFVFTSAPGVASADQVTDFATGSDKLWLDATAMSALGSSGNFGANDARFYAAAGAAGGHDADDRVVFNTTTGDLWYDADGSGGGAAQLIATLAGGDPWNPPVVATLAAQDIVVLNGGSSSGMTLNGTSGNDSLVGGTGNDTINGFGGNDTIDGAGGVDSMDGGTGNDLYFVDETGDVIVEPENGGIDEVRSTAIGYTLPDWVNNLTLLVDNASGTGNAIDNVITGNNSFNVLAGLGGNDTLIGGGIASGETADTFIGGTGNDSMVGSGAGDTFYLLSDTTTSYGQDTIIGGGEPGDVVDTIFANTGEATTGIVVDLGAGTLTGGHAGSSVVLSDIETVFGTQFADRMTGDADRNEFGGGAGDDTLAGGAGNDRLSGDAGADHYLFAATGAANADNVVGFETGVDKIHLDANVMAALGASGNLAAGDARFFAGAAAHDADDRLIFDGTTLWYDSDGTGAAAQQAVTELQTGTLVATDIAVDNGGTPPPSGGQLITGTSGNDNLSGGSGNDTINGLAGDDSLTGNAGDDSLDGGTGIDTLNGGLGNDIYVLGPESDTLVDAGGIDTIVTSTSRALPGGFENLSIIGSANADGSGNSVANILTGNSANNVLRGREGNDTVTGGGGNDFFDFVTAPGATNVDTITDFAAVDQLRFEDAFFTAIGATGTWSATDGRFWAAAGATSGHDANDRVVYNNSTGALYYDADGSGAGAAIQVATLQGAPAVSATDITVI